MSSIPVPGAPDNKPPDLPDTPSRVTVRKPRDFEMVEAKFDKSTDDAIEHWVHEQIRIRKLQYEKLHKNLVPKWRDLAAGKPKEPNKSFPWENCANLVHQVIGLEIDNLTARVLGLVYATSPLQYFRFTAKTDDPHVAARKSRLLEQFFDFVGYEPEELDLYSVDSLWLTDSARIGTAWVKTSIENRMEVVRVGYDDKAKKHSAEEDLLYKGPRVTNLAFEDVLNDPQADKPEQSCIWIHKRSMSKKELEERVYKGFFKDDAVKTIIDRPDRHGPDEIKKREARKKGMQTADDTTVLAEWDIYECWFRWFLNGKVYRLVYWDHYESKTILNRVFNFMPDNELPAVRTKLNSGEKGMNGMGYAEMLESYQEEISTTKNQRIDATTMGILGVNRVSPRNKNIDKYFKLFPGATASFDKDEFEHISVGNPSMVQASVENEQLMLQQAHDRAGIAPAVSGMGMGKWDKKGMYGSMGTLAVMQDSNTVTNYRQSDFRHARVRLATKLTKMYGAFGMGGQGSYFGLDDDLLQEALSDFLEKKIRIPIRAATASANKEVEKQNGILLSQHVMMYQDRAIKMIQALSNPQVQIDPLAKKVFTEVIKSQAAMERRLLREFGYDLPDEFVPDILADPTEELNAKTQSPATGVPPLAGAQPAPGPGGVASLPPGMVPVGAGTPELPPNLAGVSGPPKNNGGGQGR
jgi:hypothetical protein